MFDLNAQITFCKKRAALADQDSEMFMAITKSLYKLEAEKKATPHYQSFVDAYFQMREKRGSKPRWSGKAGETMKAIIAYLISLPKANGSEDKALLFWQYILDHWDDLTPYLKGRVQIGQINESIEEIIDRLKHKHENTKRPSSATKAEPGRSFGKL
jgi:hypothetical protein